MTIIPAKKYVLLKPLGDKKTKSGLVIPETQEQKPEMGIVFKIGKGEPPVDLKEGDVVIYKKYMANEITIPELGEKINPIAFDDIIAVIKEEKSEGK